MAQTNRKTEKEKDLTIITASGPLSGQEIIEIIEEFYRSGMTRNMLWDLSAADLSRLTDKEIEQIIAVSQKHARTRPTGKTAIVTSRAVDYGVVRMYEILSEIKEHTTITQSVFKDLDQALRWLES